MLQHKTNTIIHAEFKHLLLFQQEGDTRKSAKNMHFKINRKLQIKM
jgi:hypothetical protein